MQVALQVLHSNLNLNLEHYVARTFHLLYDQSHIRQKSQLSPTSFTSKNMNQHMESDVQLPFDDQSKTIQEASPSSSIFNQAELNNLVCDLGLSKVNFELLASRLKEKNALALTLGFLYKRT